MSSRMCVIVIYEALTLIQVDAYDVVLRPLMLTNSNLTTI